MNKLNHIRYRDALDFERGTGHWGQATFGDTLREPTLYAVDNSFGYHELIDVEVSEQVRSGARIAYTVHHTPLRAPLPMPPRELELPYVWTNAQPHDEDHVPALPSQVDLWCHLELASFEARIIGGAVLVSAEYTYQYSFEPVLGDS